MSEAILALTISYAQRETPLREFEVLLYEQLCDFLTEELKSERLEDDS